eukprot:UN06948
MLAGCIVKYLFGMYHSSRVSNS